MYKLIIIINNNVYETKMFDSWEDLQDYINIVSKKKKKVIFKIETEKSFILSFE